MGIVADIAERLNSQIVSAQDQSKDAKPEAQKPPVSSGLLASGIGAAATKSERAAAIAVENFVSYDRTPGRDWQINSQYQQHAVDVAEANYETQLFAKKVGEALGDRTDQTVHVDYAKYLLEQAKDPKVRLAVSAERQAQPIQEAEQKFTVAKNKNVKEAFTKTPAGLLDREATKAERDLATGSLLAAKNEFNLRAEQNKDLWKHALEVAKLDSQRRPYAGEVKDDLAACQDGFKAASQKLEEVVKATANLPYGDDEQLRP
ncbi:hypothetical protein XH83_13295 [Bradyrhizobium sp. CCBAU 53351]|uniref:hypothetical protein n=1 Tax=Bradyrhizobium sp. CCBAU 53351 TaxID=1325114 RepID=UPI0018875E74|nr:hypothetical protein [Bradyrhizobium sp. CCBAU 53351]QOZ76337.1 hypothetical protein XH83_13295 [Bradyrhizobium sp. CCBAU 53351]